MTIRTVTFILLQVMIAAAVAMGIMLLLIAIGQESPSRADTLYGFWNRAPYAPGRIQPGFAAAPVPSPIRQPCIPQPACLRKYRPVAAPIAAPLPPPDPAPPPPPVAPLPAPALALHNGSLMTVVGADGWLTISYAQPRPGLWDVGVRPGTLLIQGQWFGPELRATAYIFAYGCGPVPYPVVGNVAPGGVLVLRGLTPIVDLVSCSIVNMAWTNNSTLVFVPQV